MLRLVSCSSPPSHRIIPLLLNQPRRPLTSLLVRSSCCLPTAAEREEQQLANPNAVTSWTCRQRRQRLVWGRSSSSSASQDASSNSAPSQSQTNPEQGPPPQQPHAEPTVTTSSNTASHNNHNKNAPATPKHHHGQQGQQQHQRQKQKGSRQRQRPTHQRHHGNHHYGQQGHSQFLASNPDPNQWNSQNNHHNNNFPYSAQGQFAQSRNQGTQFTPQSNPYPNHQRDFVPQHAQPNQYYPQPQYYPQHRHSQPYPQPQSSFAASSPQSHTANTNTSQPDTRTFSPSPPQPQGPVGDGIRDARPGQSRTVLSEKPDPLTTRTRTTTNSNPEMPTSKNDSDVAQTYSPRSNLRPSWRTTTVTQKLSPRREVPTARSNNNVSQGGASSTTQTATMTEGVPSTTAQTTNTAKRVTNDLIQTVRNHFLSARQNKTQAAAQSSTYSSSKPERNEGPMPNPITDLLKNTQGATRQTEQPAQDPKNEPKEKEDDEMNFGDGKSYIYSYVQKLQEKRKTTEGSPGPILDKIPILSSLPVDNRRDFETPARQKAEAELFEMKFLKSLERSSKPASAAAKAKTVMLPNFALNLTDLADLVRVSTKKLRSILRSLGELPRVRLPDRETMVQPDVLQLVALELGLDFEVDESADKATDQEVLLQRRAATNDGASEYVALPPRPPVVCIMGHVDHGKTTLMDTLRRRSRGEDKKSEKKSKKKGKKASSDEVKDVAGTEAGGITQVISAFQVPLPGQELGVVTFLDTPGHAAFRSMRQSGSDAADIIVLVVAADDGVSPQTVEILEFYKSIVKAGGGGISLVVAMNKIDKHGINVDEARTRIESQLLEHGIFTEGMSGSTEGSHGPPVQLFPISGLTGKGVDELIEGVALQSEVMDLRASCDDRAEGYIMDARMEKGLGIVVDCVIRWGVIKAGDHILSGPNTGKVRILKDVHGQSIKTGTPSQPVRLTGFDTIPKAGDPIVCVSEDEFREKAKERALEAERAVLENSSTTDALGQAELQSAGKQMMKPEWRDKFKLKHGMDENEDTDTAPLRIPVIIRADADGTLSALRDSLLRLGSESEHNVVIDPIFEGVGPLLETEVDLAKESGATIVCFNTGKSAGSKLAEKEGLPLLSNDVIYRLLEAAQEQFSSYLPKVEERTVHGRATVGAVYDIGGLATRVAGLKVQEGTLFRNRTPADQGQHKCYFRVLRGEDVISREDLIQSTSLKHFKEDVTEVAQGKECGLSLDGHNDFEVGDEIECYSVQMKQQEL